MIASGYARRRLARTGTVRHTSPKALGRTINRRWGMAWGEDGMAGDQIRAVMAALPARTPRYRHLSGVRVVSLVRCFSRSALATSKPAAGRQPPGGRIRTSLYR